MVRNGRGKLTSKENIFRIGKAVLAGWSFQRFQQASNVLCHHSVWVMNPNLPDAWNCEKTDGSIKDWVKSLLDKAGVPK